MSTLYIVGNGFDLYHKLKSSYADFHRYVEETDNELADILENFFDLHHTDQYLWKDFENDLARFDHESYFDSYCEIDVMAESFRRSDVFGLVDELAEESENLVTRVREAFTCWIESIENPDEELLKPLMIHLSAGALFLNFNYTDTLETVYQVPKNLILYIHNNANDYSSGELIFGHSEASDGVDDSTFDENGEPTRTMFTDAQNAARSPFYAFQKDTAAVLETHREFFEKFRQLKKIIILGHSLGEVDWPYFKTISLYAPEAEWKISCYGDADHKINLARRMLGDRAKIEIINLNDLKY